MLNKQKHTSSNDLKQILQNKELNIVFDELLGLFKDQNGKAAKLDQNNNQAETHHSRIKNHDKVKQFLVRFLRKYFVFLLNIIIVIILNFYFCKEIFRLLFSGSLNWFKWILIALVPLLLSIVSFLLIKQIIDFTNYILSYKKNRINKAHKNIQKAKQDFYEDLQKKKIDVNKVVNSKISKYKYIELFIKFLIQKKPDIHKRIYSFLPAVALFYWLLIIGTFGLPINNSSGEYSLYKIILQTIGIVGFITLILKSIFEFFEAEDNIIYKECLLFLEQAQFAVDDVEIDNKLVSSQQSSNQQSIMSKLRQIKIDAPSDFDHNSDL